MQKATEKILAVTTSAHKVVAISSMDASNKRLRSLKLDLDKLVAGLKEGMDLTDYTAQETIMHKTLIDQLEDETSKKAALAKVQNETSSKDIDLEIITTERRIAKLREKLQVFDDNDAVKIRELVTESMKSTASMNMKGHMFVDKQFYKHTECMVCHQSLSDNGNMGMECPCIVCLI